MTIETDRLILRKMNENDYDALYAVLADLTVMEDGEHWFTTGEN